MRDISRCIGNSRATARRPKSIDRTTLDLPDGPTRRAVIQRLGRGTASVSELAEPFKMALPSFMKHLGILEAAGDEARRWS